MVDIDERVKNLHAELRAYRTEITTWHKSATVIVNTLSVNKDCIVDFVEFAVLDTHESLGLQQGSKQREYITKHVLPRCYGSIKEICERNGFLTDDQNTKYHVGFMPPSFINLMAQA